MSGCVDGHLESPDHADQPFDRSVDDGAGARLELGIQQDRLRQRLEIPRGAVRGDQPIQRRRGRHFVGCQLPPQLSGDERCGLRLAQDGVAETGVIQGTRDAKDGLDVRVVLIRQHRRSTVRLDAPASERTGALPHVDLRVAAPVAECEQLHELPREVLVGLLRAVTGAVEPDQHRGVGQHRDGQRSEVAEFEGAQFLILHPHPCGDRHLLRRRCKVVVPQQRQFLVNRFLNGCHPAHPPRRQFVHLRGQLLTECVQFGRAHAATRRRGRDRQRSWRRECAWIAFRVEGKDRVEVDRPVLARDRVDLRPRGAETGAPKHAGGGMPPRRLSRHRRPTVLPSCCCVLPDSNLRSERKPG